MKRKVRYVVNLSRDIFESRKGCYEVLPRRQSGEYPCPVATIEYGAGLLTKKQAHRYANMVRDAINNEQERP